MSFKKENFLVNFKKNNAEMTQEKTRFSQKNVFRDIILVLLTAVLTSYFSIEVFGTKLEERKSDLEFEQFIKKETQTQLKELSSLIGLLHNKATLYRQYDFKRGLVPDFLLELVRKKYPIKIEKDYLFDLQTKLQAQIFALQPLISEQLFLKLGEYSILMNYFIHLDSISRDDQMELYKKASKTYKEIVDSMKLLYTNNFDSSLLQHNID